MYVVVMMLKGDVRGARDGRLYLRCELKDAFVMRECSCRTTLILCDSIPSEQITPGLTHATSSTITRSKGGAQGQQFC